MCVSLISQSPNLSPSLSPSNLLMSIALYLSLCLFISLNSKFLYFSLSTSLFFSLRPPPSLSLPLSIFLSITLDHARPLSTCVKKKSYKTSIELKNVIKTEIGPSLSMLMASRLFIDLVCVCKCCLGVKMG